MKAFRAIVALTFRNAMRSHIFQLLLVLLLLCVTVIPISVSVGKTEDLIRVSLLYSLWSVSAILALSSLWLGCYIMSHDIDSYQIHMVVSKPVSRITVWLGKWVGINLINIVLLLISGLVVYGVVMYRYQSAGEEDIRFSERAQARRNAESERDRIRNQILVGRRSYMPEKRDPEAAAQEAVRRRVIDLQKEGKVLSDEEIQKMYTDYKEQIDQLPVEVIPIEVDANGRPLAVNSHTWVFKNIPEDLNKKAVVLRFRPYLNKIASEDQRLSTMWWAVQNPVLVKSAGEDGSFRAVTDEPESYFTGEFHEIPLPYNVEDMPQGMVGEDGTVKIRVINADIQKGKHYYQVNDGPKLLVPVCSFEMNYLRAMAAMILQLMLLFGLACAFGGFLTMPTAIFMVASYLLFGSLSMVLTDSSFYVSTAWDHLGQFLAQALLLIVIPLQNFDVTNLLSGGDLIEFSLLGELFFNYFLLRGVPLFVLGIWLYVRRELGSAVRK